MTAITEWALAHPLAAATAGVLLVAAALLALRPLRRTPAAVVVASLAALACTAYSADTSWRFAEHSLDMVSTGERAAMFAAAELALFACALMARQNLRTQGAPGTPGILVWLITGVQVIPAYSESGIVGGTVRAVVGPILAALLWHLAMGIELRHTKPGSASSSLPAVIARELRERLLSWLGLATRDRSAEQITRDRATARAVRLASRPKLRRWGRSRLAAAVARSGVATDPAQRDTLMQLLAARRSADALSTVTLASPWEAEVERVPDVPETYPEIEQAVPVIPDAVPRGARMLPIVARPERRTYRLDSFREQMVPNEPAPVLPAEAPRTRPEVHAEYVPEAAPDWTIDGTYAEEKDNPAQEDPLTQLGLGWAAEQFKEELLAGGMPSIRDIKSRLRVGQPRAQEIQEGFRKAQVAWRLAGQAVRS
ncbi:hypothetical protein [Streptomyces sp. bgisy034]|uniref:hypothetical protein n=1 Tax=Streptomyces sp. bgisy034 TaxID=3413774 RepID=UPI003EBCDFB5